MNLNFSDWIGIIGLIVSVVGTLLGLEYFKKRKYPGQVSFIIQDSIRLVQDIIKNFPQIRILYNNEPINEQIAFFKGSFLNSGIIDIDKPMIKKPLTILAPEGCRWISAQITNTSEEVECQVEIQSSNKLVFIHDLMRINEFFEFESFLEIADDLKGKGFIDLLKVEHRITNVQKIKATGLEPVLKVDNSKSLLITLSRQAIVCFLMVLSIVIFSYITRVTGLDGSPKNTTYFTYIDKNEKVHIVRALLNVNYKIQLIEKDGAWSKEIAINEAQNTLKLKPVTISVTVIDVVTKASAAFIVLLIFTYSITLSIHFSNRSKRRLFKILKSNNSISKRQ